MSEIHSYQLDITLRGMYISTRVVRVLKMPGCGQTPPTIPQGSYGCLNVEPIFQGA